MISFIAAASDNNVIGQNNKMPWHLPSDLKFFKNTTWGLPIIMGRKTFESMGKALPGRTNIVVTTNAGFVAKNVEVAGSIAEAIEKAEALNTHEIFIIGGGKIFEQALPLAQRVYLTRVHLQVDGDAFFPALDPAQWELKQDRLEKADEKNAYDHSFQVWERKQ